MKTLISISSPKYHICYKKLIEKRPKFAKSTGGKKQENLKMFCAILLIVSKMHFSLFLFGIAGAVNILYVVQFAGLNLIKQSRPPNITESWQNLPVLNNIKTLLHY